MGLIHLEDIQSEAHISSARHKKSSQLNHYNVLVLQILVLFLTHETLDLLSTIKELTRSNHHYAPQF